MKWIQQTTCMRKSMTKYSSEEKRNKRGAQTRTNSKNNTARLVLYLFALLVRFLYIYSGLSHQPTRIREICEYFRKKRDNQKIESIFDSQIKIWDLFILHSFDLFADCNSQLNCYSVHWSVFKLMWKNNNNSKHIYKNNVTMEIVNKI